MDMPKVFVSRIIPDKGLDMINEVAEAEVWQDEMPPPYEVLLEKVSGVDGLVSDVVVASISAIVFQFHLADCLFVADLCRAA